MRLRAPSLLEGDGALDLPPAPVSLGSREALREKRKSDAEGEVSSHASEAPPAHEDSPRRERKTRRRVGREQRHTPGVVVTKGQREREATEKGGEKGGSEVKGSRLHHGDRERRDAA